MIIVVAGPTCVGKTKLSEHLSNLYDGIVINADAVSVYKDLNIGSAKPTLEEMSDKPHYMFDYKSVTEDFNVFDYQTEVRKIINENKNRNIILVGGTGLYINAALYDYKFLEKKDVDTDNLTTEELYNLALEKDKNNNIDKNNRVRLINFITSGSTNNGNKLLYDAIFIGLKADREVLYDKINQRVDIMFSNGLLEEVKNLYHLKNQSRVLNSAIGYKEVISYLDNEITYEEMLDKIKQNSRKYAKRQFTWFNNKNKMTWFNTDYDNFNTTIDEVVKYVKEHKKG